MCNNLAIIIIIIPDLFYSMVGNVHIIKAICFGIIRLGFIYFLFGNVLPKALKLECYCNPDYATWFDMHVKLMHFDAKKCINKHINFRNLFKFIGVKLFANSS